MDSFSGFLSTNPLALFHNFPAGLPNALLSPQASTPPTNAAPTKAKISFASSPYAITPSAILSAVLGSVA